MFVGINEPERDVCAGVLEQRPVGLRLDHLPERVVVTSAKEVLGADDLDLIGQPPGHRGEGVEHPELRERDRLRDPRHVHPHRGLGAQAVPDVDVRQHRDRVVERLATKVDADRSAMVAQSPADRSVVKCLELSRMFRSDLGPDSRTGPGLTGDDLE